MIILVSFIRVDGRFGFENKNAAPGKPHPIDPAAELSSRIQALDAEIAVILLCFIEQTSRHFPGNQSSYITYEIEVEKGQPSLLFLPGRSSIQLPIQKVWPLSSEFSFL